ncbi:MAG: LLM class flavin-dependent oxidoreductase [Actinobacteria bacterium]|nr:LLM class flavin-dependent oxidoreductase [Actinomycetota bacterium]
MTPGPEPLRMGLVLPMFSGRMDRVLDSATRAEELGFDGVFAFDHFFPPGASPDRPSLEAFATLGAVAAETGRLSVGTLVTRAQLRPAGLVAKMAATLDDMAGGRMILGVGTGDPIDLPEHETFGFTSLGVADRRAHLAETVGAVRALFRGEAWPGGEHVPAVAGPLRPPPPSPGGPPIWIGAQADEVVRLAGALADGWNGWGLDAGAFARKARVLGEAAGEAGRPPGAVEATWAGIALVGEDDARTEELLAARRSKGMPVEGIWWGSAERFAGFLGELREAGATWVVIVPAGPPDRVELIARDVLPAIS